ncbi:MAG: tRNA uridine-5-carboxymethylaminomethyl(34) synthesis GTPase MnmE, partial [Erysipelotrichaceae bacterium]|nr:tRNA uridine-5-carboxymethylaminomethyl(34) synthesis GTPase MnmE [Erysipelotrichaceae bacterium]
MMNDTIAAIATPLAQGAISIIRVSGSDAVTIVQSIFDRDLKHQKANTITYGFIVEPNSGNRVDEVLVSLFRAPHSFSGEDVVEINCHGGVYITKEVLALVLGAGARLAHPGEFSQRAFLNGRIDLTQAEAIMDLISAKDQVNAQQALSGIR